MLDRAIESIPVRLYRPGSGTEGIGFYERWCFKCKRDAHMNSGKDWDQCEPHEICSIIGDTLAYEVDDPKYPKEWIYAQDGRPMCLAFESMDKPDRCEHTVDMFTGQRGDADGGLLIVAILLMVFLFQGTPDVWDMLHAYVMHALEIKK